jgi:histidyl-tRNA synthetase
VDTVGSDAPLADAECIAAIAAAFDDLGIKGFSIRVNSRKILDGILESAGVPSAQKIEAMRILDKLDKAGKHVVAGELSVLGLSKAQIAKLLKLLNANITNEQALREVLAVLLLDNQHLAEGVNELAQVLSALAGFGVKNVLVDLKLARGLDYYTGTVCEITLDALPNFGSIAGGGRYDQLIGEIAGSDKIVPAVGMSIGIDRLFAALEELGLMPVNKLSGVMIFNLDESLLPVYQTMAKELRLVGVAVELYYKPADWDKQFRYAEKKKVALALIVGEQEIKAGKVKIKILSTRKQITVKAEQLVGRILKLLRA